MTASNQNTPLPSDTPPEQDDLPHSTDNALRRKALHRLIGAGVLVLIGVLVLPWVFDAKPPKLSPDIQLHIEDTETTPPSTKLAQADNKAPAPEVTPKTQQPTPQKPSTPAPTKTEENKKPKPEPESKPQQKTKLKPKPKPKPAKKQPQTLDELIAQRTKKPKTDKKSAATQQFPEKGRFVVQVGAYTDANRVRAVRQKLTKAGLKNYIQNIQVKGKTVTRVRLGPFKTRKKLQAAAAKAQALGFKAKLYSL